MNALKKKFGVASISSFALILTTIASINASPSQGFSTANTLGSDWSFTKQNTYPASHQFSGLVGNSDQSRLLTSTYDINGNHLLQEGLSLSEDHGLTWRNLEHDCRSPVQISNDGSKIYCRNSNFESILIDSSINGGVNWNSILVYGDNTSQQNIPDLFKDAAFASSQDGSKLFVAMASVQLHDLPTSPSIMGGIFISSDSGSTWNQVDTDPDQGWGSITVSADGSNLVASTRAYVIRDGSIIRNGLNATSSLYVSHNAGLTWEKRLTISPIKIHGPILDSKLVSSRDGKIVYALFNGSVSRSMNAGDSWTRLNLHRLGLDSGIIATSDSGKQVVVSGSASVLFFSNDYGKTWVVPAGQKNLYSKMWTYKNHSPMTIGWSQLLFSGNGKHIEGVMFSENGDYSSYAINLPTSNVLSTGLHFAFCVSLDQNTGYYSFVSKLPYCRRGFRPAPGQSFPE